MKVVDNEASSSQPRRTALGVKVWLALVAVPAIAFAAAMLVHAVVPGCLCDEGSGCRGCGLNGLVEFCMFGGFIGALCAALFGWPIIFLVKLFEFGTTRARDDRAAND